MQKTRTAAANLTFGGWDSLADTPFVPQKYRHFDLPDALQPDDGHAIIFREATGEYAAIQQGWLNTEPDKSKLKDTQGHYKRMLQADRRLREEYEDMTAVFMTLTQSPSDESGNRIPPWTLVDNLTANGVRPKIPRKVKRSLSYKDINNVPWFSVVGVTDEGTSHEHYTFLPDDPNNVVTADDFMPALNAHVKNVPTAHWDDHNPDGPAVQVQHTPVTGDNGATKATTYTGKNLPHMKLRDYVLDDRPNPTNADYIGGTLAWARGDKEPWVRFSRGI